MFIGLASCISRLAAGVLCNLKSINPRFVFQVGGFLSAVSVFLFTIECSYSLLVLFSLLFGLGQGILVTTSNLTFLTCVDNKRRASAFGLANCLTSSAVILSPPLAGFLADELESYAPAFFFAGSALVITTLLPFVLLCTQEPDSTIASEQEMIPVDNAGEMQYVSGC